MSNSDSRVVLITGTSSGIGLHAAIAAARAGWTTVATLRDTTKSGALVDAATVAGVTLDIRGLDVTDADAVRSVIAEVVADHGRLDAVVNNAGSAKVGTVELLTDEDFRSAFEVNFFGVVAVTREAMPHLRASGGRVITISSVGGIVGQPFNDAYCASKFAVEGMLESLRPVAETVGVTVCVIEPAAVASEFIANANIADDPLATAGAYAPALGAYLERTRSAFSNAQSAHDVGKLIAETLDRIDPPFRIQTSPGATAFVGLKIADLDGSAVQGLTRTWLGLS